eukprot:CAMPEP_0184090812 /NCGR_PEP_ID=MMETSP0974-20121125/7418_1 /TAXON_ID=483370 /ORGANISM="non described non described, Strain CCMP2097" /LENGTH=264 /DNA_ID=CAMNT_0026393537 /DNA_START=1 /DNA_END=792 /DNA_ORIENTATION=+
MLQTASPPRDDAAAKPTIEASSNFAALRAKIGASLAPGLAGAATKRPAADADASDAKRAKLDDGDAAAATKAAAPEFEALKARLGAQLQFKPRPPPDDGAAAGQTEAPQAEAPPTKRTVRFGSDVDTAEAWPRFADDAVPAGRAPPSLADMLQSRLEKHSTRKSLTRQEVDDKNKPSFATLLRFGLEKTDRRTSLTQNEILDLAARTEASRAADAAQALEAARAHEAAEKSAQDRDDAAAQQRRRMPTPMRLALQGRRRSRASF